MHEILGGLHAFSGVFDSVVGNMTNVSHDIMEYVKCPTLGRIPTHEPQVTASLDDTLTRLSRQQSEQQAHALLEVPVAALCLTHSMADQCPGGCWCFPSLDRGANAHHSRELHSHNPTACKFFGKCHRNLGKRAIIPLGDTSPTGSIT